LTRAAVVDAGVLTCAAVSSVKLAGAGVRSTVETADWSGVKLRHMAWSTDAACSTTTESTHGARGTHRPSTHSCNNTVQR